MTSHLNMPNLLRTALYVPASNHKALQKAPALAVDAIIIDLEDSVAPEAKDAVRRDLPRILPSILAGKAFPGLLVIRVNGADTPWQTEDIAAAMALQPDALLFPKIGSAADVTRCRQAMDRHATTKPVAIWAMIETPAGVLNAPAIASALGKNNVMVLGLNDLAKETGMQQQPGRLPMAAVLSTTVLAARMHGLVILDGVFNAIADEAGFAEECQQGKAFGFDGKTIIHPRQIETANAIFGPSEEDIADAQAIVAIFDLPENAAKGVVAMTNSNGTRMVERLHLAMAKTLLAKAARIVAQAKD